MTANNSGNNNIPSTTPGTTIVWNPNGFNGGQWITVAPAPAPATHPSQISLDFTGIDLTAPVKTKKYGNCTCKKCGEFYPYAESNQDDGTLICWPCRHFG